MFSHPQQRCFQRITELSGAQHRRALDVEVAEAAVAQGLGGLENFLYQVVWEGLFFAFLVVFCTRLQSLRRFFLKVFVFFSSGLGEGGVEELAGLIELIWVGLFDGVFRII